MHTWRKNIFTQEELGMEPMDQLARQKMLRLFYIESVILKFNICVFQSGCLVAIKNIDLKNDIHSQIEIFREISSLSNSKHENVCDVYLKIVTFLLTLKYIVLHIISNKQLISQVYIIVSSTYIQQLLIPLCQKTNKNALGQNPRAFLMLSDKCSRITRKFFRLVY